MSDSLYTVTASLGIGYIAYAATAALVPLLADDLISKGLSGRDMLKPGFKRKGDGGTAAGKLL
jgi:UDP-N-acetylglucosamine--dolichyl-phosphate N-acetylglucosaminephosphotransferase